VNSASRWWVGLPELGPIGRQHEFEARLSTSPSSRADVSIDAVDDEAYCVRACAVRGLAHRHRRMTRQDDYAIGESVTGHVILAVADGLSSSPLGHIAATIACRSAHAAVAAAMAEGGLAESIRWDNLGDRVSSAVAGEARRIGAVDERAPDTEVASVMATTLVVAVVERDASRATIASVAGDSVAFLLREGQWEQLIGGAPPDGSLEESSVKSWLPGRARPTTVSADLAGTSAVLLCSDGLANVLKSGGRPAETIAEWWRTPPGLTEFATQLNFLLKGVDDDRSAVMLWPVASFSPGDVAPSSPSPWHQRLFRRWRPLSSERAGQISDRSGHTHFEP